MVIGRYLRQTGYIWAAFDYLRNGVFNARNELPPDLVMMFTTPPAFCPYSAL